ncbi:uncharacterized protein LOC118912767 isoform X2 [Manis pentadactyla]|uniref:uncharacterized protein LOC118912767 isoform X2 n=1 Tax=Manis pentadactyla TaxID=143292 RepID=UPI00255CD063|nr:uncharacterized protein LOC118912767 isoform X2 [Manis pentadactyla]
MVFGACPVLSFTSPPSSRWVEPREPLQGAAYAVQKAAVFPPRKKKIIKAASAPAARKVPIPSAGYLEKQSDSRSEAVAAATEPGNSNAGGGLFLILPSIYPAQELPSLLFLPSFKGHCPSCQGAPHRSCTCRLPWSQPDPSRSCAAIRGLFHPATEMISYAAAQMLPSGRPALMNWGDPPQKPTLSACNSRIFGHLRARGIPSLTR